MPAAPRAASVSPSKINAALGAASQRYPARSRLRKTDEISSVFDFRCREQHLHLTGLAKPNQLGIPRLAVMVSKKVAPSAVRRNYMRRVLRESFRQSQALLPALDVVIRVTKSFNHAHFVEICDEMNAIMQRLGKCLKS